KIARPPRVQKEGEAASAGGKGAAAASERAPSQARSAPPPRSAQRPRKGRRNAPRPKLSKAALEGTAPLRSFGELRAFFDAQQQAEQPQAQVNAEPVSEPAESSEVPSS